MLVISPDDMDELEIGASLERVLGYLRTLLPGEPGFIDVRARYSLDDAEAIHVVTSSEWLNWEDLESHRTSNLSEEKVLQEFGPHITPDDLELHVYREIG